MNYVQQSCLKNGENLLVYNKKNKLNQSTQQIKFCPDKELIVKVMKYK